MSGRHLRAPRSNPPAETTRPSGAITISTGGIGVEGISAPLIDPLVSETVTSIVAVPSSSTVTTFQLTTCVMSMENGWSPISSDEI